VPEGFVTGPQGSAPVIPPHHRAHRCARCLDARRGPAAPGFAGNNRGPSPLEQLRSRLTGSPGLSLFARQYALRAARGVPREEMEVEATGRSRRTKERYTALGRDRTPRPRGGRSGEHLAEATEALVA